MTIVENIPQFVWLKNHDWFKIFCNINNNTPPQFLICNQVVFNENTFLKHKQILFKCNLNKLKIINNYYL